jgi:hypothetical protein
VPSVACCFNNFFYPLCALESFVLNTLSSPLSLRLRQTIRLDPLGWAYSCGVLLRPYQRGIALALKDSIVNHLGLTFVVIFPRQSGKNELQAHIFSWLLLRFSHSGGRIVSVSPTFKPQTTNNMERVAQSLDACVASRRRWKTSKGYMYKLGKACLQFFSGDTHARVVGATADLLLSVDEAQEVDPAKFDKDFDPMTASTNATRVFWGTAWTSNTLLERQRRIALQAQQKDGIQRVFFFTADDVRRLVPAYGKTVDRFIEERGRNHPLVRTQFFCETIDAQSGMFTPARIALIFPSIFCPPKYEGHVPSEAEGFGGTPAPEAQPSGDGRGPGAAIVEAEPDSRHVPVSDRSLGARVESEASTMQAPSPNLGLDLERVGVRLNSDDENRAGVTSKSGVRDVVPEGYRGEAPPLGGEPLFAASALSRSTLSPNDSEGIPVGRGADRAGAIAFLIDVAGMDESKTSLASSLLSEGLGNPGRDSTTLTIVAVDLSTLAELHHPTYRVLARHSWTGQNHLTVFGQIKNLAKQASPQFIVIDATGVGEGLWALLDGSFPTRVIPVKFTSQEKSEIGWRFLNIIETGRFIDPTPPDDLQNKTVRLQYHHCISEILPGPSKTLRWGVPDGTRGPDGELIHDDYILADALTAVLDRLEWHISTTPYCSEGFDPLLPSASLEESYVNRW